LGWYPKYLGYPDSGGRPENPFLLTIFVIYHPLLSV